MDPKKVKGYFNNTINNKLTIKEEHTRRYNVSGSRTIANYLWGTFSLIGGFSFLITGLYSYYINFFFQSENLLNGSFVNIDCWLCLIIEKSFSNLDTVTFFNKNPELGLKILFFPQGLSMCFYGLTGILVGIYLWFCIAFGVGCGFTEFNKKKGIIKVFRLGFPGQNRFINYAYTLDNIQCICVKISSNILSTAPSGVYMRINTLENQTLDIPLDLYLEKTSIETIESQAADLAKFLRISLSIQ